MFPGTLWVAKNDPKNSMIPRCSSFSAAKPRGKIVKYEQHKNNHTLPYTSIHNHVTNMYQLTQYFLKTAHHIETRNVQVHNPDQRSFSCHGMMWWMFRQVPALTWPSPHTPNYKNTGLCLHVMTVHMWCAYAYANAHAYVFVKNVCMWAYAHM